MADGSDGAGEARALASGALLQQAAQVAGLLAMLAIVTVLARRLERPEFGVYALLNSISGYLLIVQNSAAGAAVRAMAASREEESGDRAYSTAAVTFAGAGLITGAALGGIGIGMAEALDLSDAATDDARGGALLLALATAVGWPLLVQRDVLRARGRVATAARAEIAAVVVYAAVVLALAFADAPLWLLIGAGGTLPLFVGVLSAGVVRARGLGYRLRPRLATAAERRSFLALAGFISAGEAAATAVYALGRVVLGLVKSPSVVAIFEGPMRIHNLVRALSAAITVPVLAAGSRYHAEADRRRTRELLMRGSRYSLALIVPIAVTGMVMAGPLLEAWLGNDFGEGAAALAIMLAHWMVTGLTAVATAVLIAADRARDYARWALWVALASIALTLALVEPLGIEGVALAISVPYLLGTPFLVRMALAEIGQGPAGLVRTAVVPAWRLGGVLAVLLAGLRLALDPDGIVAVLAVCGGALVAYWAAYYVLELNEDERALVRTAATR